MDGVPSVFDEASRRDRCPPGCYHRRAIFSILASFAFWIIGIGVLMALGENKMTWHDQWSRTAVYIRPKSEAAGFPIGSAPLSIETDPGSPTPT